MAPPGAASSRIVRFAAEDWPPFISRSLPADGMSGAMVSAVFERLGYTVKYDYFPWKRAMQFGLASSRYAGFLAVWRTPEREKLCHFSVPVGNTQGVLAYLKEDGVPGASLADLGKLRIGTVAGYSNGEQFDGMVARGELKTEEGLNDATNLKKLFIKRYRVIVIERHVLQHLLMGRNFSKAERERIAVIDTVFKERPVHVCFQRDAGGAAWQKRFNEAARDIDTARLERDYWKRLDQSLATAPATP
ncbi:transporter substrate-binding domain-containing protein [Janthinobacterium sp. SUN026]|uniref:substrate-binding periplasmic protein n=1 Tax=unclassified Janthinobacterium TaxID=2610881 RepID=UPI0025B39A6A|nr:MULTISPECIES: transporter substrate-binding domain-containing protein [unclassified Janthinobacterium]MDN2673799.1 transporter substrate-binding domain-containing protein [Janthinobacterium sp. SUN026]MDN2704947.1 transporter substrate-binding domain-containing protein [Janthinobacterium sp. SUN100]